MTFLRYEGVVFGGSYILSEDVVYMGNSLTILQSQVTESFKILDVGRIYPITKYFREDFKKNNIPNWYCMF